MAKEQLCRSGAPLSATWWLLPTAYADESSSTGVRACRCGSWFRVSASCCESRASAMDSSCVQTRKEACAKKARGEWGMPRPHNSAVCVLRVRMFTFTPRHRLRQGVGTVAVGADRAMVCGVCGGTGHNRRTCIASRISSESPSEISKFTASVPLPAAVPAAVPPPASGAS
eukprot:scaffold82330_cov54-Phaeocystis_antarctica.AAC.1